MTRSYSCIKILGMRLDAITIEQTINQILKWAIKEESKYVCVSNVHMCMEAKDNSNYQTIVNNADLVVPDGKPLVLAGNMLGKAQYEHIRGADLTRYILKQADNKKLKIGLYGGAITTLKEMSKNININYNNIKLVATISPPFRELSDQEDEYYVKEINEAGVQILLVGLGCPKQEKWMAEHKGRIKAVMIGIGAVFDFIGGNKKEAPKWFQVVGLEWLFRLISEPKRLWRRYLYHNPRFIINICKQYMSSRLRKV